MIKDVKHARQLALQRQTARLERRIARLNRISRRFAWVRLGVFLAGVLLTGLAFYVLGLWQAGICAGAFLFAFSFLVYCHRQADQSIYRHHVWLRIKSAHIARMTLDWAHIPAFFGQRPQFGHPFELDLDLVGEKSLHRLLDTAVSYQGSQRLWAWLTAPVSEPAQIIRRQRLVRELAPLTLYRDKLVSSATLAAGTTKTWRANHLIDWLERHAPARSQRAWLLLGLGLVGLNAVLFVADQWGWLPPLWRITFLLYLGLLFWRSKETSAAFDQAIALEGALKQLRGAFSHLESFSYRNQPHLKTLCAPFLHHERRPSRYFSRITRILAAMGVRGNPVLWFALNAVLPWDFFVTFQLDRYKQGLARHAPAWLDAWFELEALSALANFAYLNPHYTFPDVYVGESVDGPPFEARGLGHPLIPDDARVCNDFTVPELSRAIIITGSNMTGKSVFLKTVGVNLALAFAGGPVVAQRLRTRVFRLFTSMKVSDSVTSGLSYFFAEVKRLKALLTALEGTHDLPLFFLIDEIFRGTNNRERLIGSQAYVRALIGQHGIGLIATHDLELAKLADVSPQIENYHFCDHFIDNRMMFDYTLRTGPCPTTNALKIMQMEGLPVQ